MAVLQPGLFKLRAGGKWRWEGKFSLWEQGGCGENYRWRRMVSARGELLAAVGVCCGVAGVRGSPTSYNSMLGQTILPQVTKLQLA